MAKPRLLNMNGTIVRYEDARVHVLSTAMKYAASVYEAMRAYWSDADQQLYDPIYGATNAGRLPTFQQLDLRVDRVFLFDRWMLALYLDVQNVLDHTNQEGVIVDYRYRTQIVVPDIPILPTIGVRGSF